MKALLFAALEMIRTAGRAVLGLEESIIQRRNESQDAFSGLALKTWAIRRDLDALDKKITSALERDEEQRKARELTDEERAMLLGVAAVKDE